MRKVPYSFQLQNPHQHLLKTSTPADDPTCILPHSLKIAAVNPILKNTNVNSMTTMTLLQPSLPLQNTGEGGGQLQNHLNSNNLHEPFQSRFHSKAEH